jgi:hypothetical protein
LGAGDTHVRREGAKEVVEHEEKAETKQAKAIVGVKRVKEVDTALESVTGGVSEGGSR